MNSVIEPLHHSLEEFLMLVIEDNVEERLLAGIYFNMELIVLRRNIIRELNI